jgi:DNA-binding transcriptional MerR regulator
VLLSIPSVKPRTQEEAVRISELSKESGVSVPTIKYYVREGLLPSGRPTAPNQADYGEQHVHRLRLIRALIDVGSLPVATIRDVIAAIDDRELSMHEVLGVAHRALGPPPPDNVSPARLRDERTEVDGFLKGLGWRVSEDSPGRLELVHALATLRRLGWDVDAQVFDRYARLADDLASWELTQTPVNTDREETVEAAVVGTVVFEAVLVALRRLAQENHSAIRFAAAVK